MVTTLLGVALALLAALAAGAVYLLRKDFITGKVDERIPIVGSRGFMGFVPDMARKAPTIVFTEVGLKPEHQPLAAFHVLGNPMVIVSDPAYAQLVITNPLLRDKPDSGYRNLKLFLGRKNLVALGGEEWVFQRRLLNKVFSSSNMHTFHRSFVRSSQTLISILHELPQARPVGFDLHEKLRLLTMDVISDSIMCEDFGFQRAPHHPLLLNLMAGLEETAAMNIDPMFRRYHPLARWRFTRATRYVSRFFGEVIAAHRTAPPDSPKHRDLIGLMLAAQDEQTGARLTQEDILSQCLTFFFAGHDTTAATMAWAMYAIATMPEVERRVLAEVDAVLGERTVPDYEDLGKFRYLTCVIKEALRLYPPASQFLREAQSDLDLGEYRIRKGTAVLINSTALHVLPEHWPDPYRFDPDRFSEENSVGRHPFSWLPFSAKERVCIGMNFAMMEIKCVLAMLYRQFVFRADNLRRPEFVYHVMTGPKDLIMYAVPRSRGV